MIRYNNISRPRLQRPPCDPPCDPPAQNLGVATISPLDSNGKEAFSGRKKLSRGGLRRMKMPQEKNGKNTDLKCDLVLCRNKDYEKEDITKLEAFEMKVWHGMEKDQLDRAH